MSVATLGELRDAVKATLQVDLPELYVYQQVVDSPNLPCVIVMPITATFGFSKSTPDDDWQFDLFVLVSKSDTGLSQDALDQYISSGGPKSIRELVKRFSRLGIEGPGTSVRARIIGMSNYGGQVEAAGIDHIGATLRLVVTITGPR